MTAATTPATTTPATTTPAGTARTAPEPAGDWLVVPLPPVQRGWRWGRIVAQLPGPGPARFRVRWVGSDRDSVVVPLAGYRIESAARWPEPPSSAIGRWPDPAAPS